MVTGDLIDKNTPEGYKKFITEGLIEIEFTIDFFIVFWRKGYIYAFNAYYGPILGGTFHFFIIFFIKNIIGYKYFIGYNGKRC